jgi:hypothetical protein
MLYHTTLENNYLKRASKSLSFCNDSLEGLQFLLQVGWYFQQYLKLGVALHLKSLSDHYLVRPVPSYPTTYSHWVYSDWGVIGFICSGFIPIGFIPNGFIRIGFIPNGFIGNIRFGFIHWWDDNTFKHHPASHPLLNRSIMLCSS